MPPVLSVRGLTTVFDTEADPLTAVNGISFDIRRDEQELEDCRWFTREETAAMIARSAATGLAPGTTTPPPKGAIAHRLMRDWLDWKV